MEREVLFIAVTTQKGGTGKTTLTTLIASYLQYCRGVNVAVVDCDYSQHSFSKHRKRELRNIKEDEFYNSMAKKFFSNSGALIYPVVESKPENAIERAEELYANLTVKPEIIFFDLPGTLANTGIVSPVSLMDFVFCPLAADMMDINSGLSFASIINEGIIKEGKGRLKNLFVFWNKVDRRERTDLYRVYNDSIMELGLSRLKTELPSLLRFKHEMTSLHRPVFRSTVFPPDSALIEDSKVVELVDEILEIVKN